MKGESKMTTLYKDYKQAVALLERAREYALHELAYCLRDDYATELLKDIDPFLEKHGDCSGGDA